MLLPKDLDEYGFSSFKLLSKKAKVELISLFFFTNTLDELLIAKEVKFDYLVNVKLINSFELE